MRSAVISAVMACIAMLLLTLSLLLGPFATPPTPEPQRTPPPTGGGIAFQRDAERTFVDAAVDRSANPRAAAEREELRRAVEPSSPVVRAKASLPTAQDSVLAPAAPAMPRDPRAQRRRRDEAAFADALRVLDAEPMNAGALQVACEAALALERWSDACALFERRLNLEPNDPDLRFAFASVLMRLANWSSAARELNRVVQDSPQHARAWYNLALAQQAAGQLTDAERTWSRAIELQPDDADARAHRGELRLDLHDWRRAEEDFAAACARAPDDAGLVLNLALALEKGGRSADAERVLLDLHVRRPRDVRVMNRLAELAWAQGAASSADAAAQRARAADWCRRSLAIDADQPSIAALLGATLSASAP